MLNLFKKIKENKSFILPWIILGVSIIIFGSGLTYAYFDFILNSQSASSLRVTGTDFDVAVYATTINATNLTPIYEEYVDSQAQTFEFSVENNSRKLASCYSLSLDITQISPSLISEDFNWKLTNTRTSTVVASGNFSSANTTSDMILDSEISLSVRTSDTYEFKVWLSNTESNQNSVQSSTFAATIKLSAEAGICEAIRSNTAFNSVRYIKDCINGNSVNSDNQWVELQAIYNGQNVAYGKTVTGTSAVNTGVNSGTYTTIVDGITTAVGANTAQAVSYGLQCITVDLSQTYDLDEITVWHYYADGRTYYSNTIYVSTDGSNWTPIMANTRAETSSGKRITVYGDAKTIIPVYRVSNLVINGSFENGSTNWTLNTGVTVSNSVFKYGTYAARNYHAVQYQNANNTAYAVNAINGNKYYASGWLHTAAKGTGNCYTDLNLIYNGADHWQGSIAGLQATLNTWELQSNIYTMPSGTTPKIALATAVYTQTDATEDCYGDGLFLVDLTSTFGAGNEPTKAWCDSNLSYFDGSQNLSLSLD